MRKFSGFATTAVLLSAWFVGCSTAPVVDHLSDGGENRISPNDVVNIALPSGLAERKETFSGPMNIVNERMLVETGPVWQRVFVGQANAPASLEIVSTHLDQSVGGMGFVLRFTYDVVAKLHVGDQVYPIIAHGSRAAGMQINSARRQAVELAVIDAALQCTAILRVTAKPTPS